MDAAFWNFSLKIYRQPGVADECLHLQDNFGVDVNLLLFCAFAGAARGAVLAEADLAEATALVREWHNDVVKTLRTVRRALKPFGARQDWELAAAAEVLRTQVKAVELESERLEQAMLSKWGAGRLGQWPRKKPETAIATNIRALLALSVQPEQGLPETQLRLIAAALSASV